ncbi:MAG TPA: RNA polymerase sigma factor [Opitutaceae bacterium]|jgi:RNA polymerase sigma-70 factor (ECF subfamily)|nr:RNA polymerase sigma factor [Opitutaceae bacterium]
MAEPSDSNFAAFYRATLAPLRRYLGRVLGNAGDAQEVAHDAYARYYESAGRRKVERPQAFLFTIARRLAISRLRRRQAGPVRESGGQIIELTASEAPGVERLVMARQEWARLEAAITHLPSGCRAVLALCHEGELSHAEIGAKLGIAISTVEKQHARALRLLRAALQDDAADRSSGDRSCAGGR